MNKCVKCGLNFRSVSGFDEHRVGDLKNWGANRRCLSTEELTNIGMVDIDGAWRRPAAQDAFEELHQKNRAAKSAEGVVGTPQPENAPVLGYSRARGKR